MLKIVLPFLPDIIVLEVDILSASTDMDISLLALLELLVIAEMETNVILLALIPAKLDQVMLNLFAKPEFMNSPLNKDTFVMLMLLDFTNV